MRHAPPCNSKMKIMLNSRFGKQKGVCEKVKNKH